MARITFLLGGARSGKSSYAIELANRISNKVLYLATGVSCDDEMKARIEMHKKTRPESWIVVEEPLNVESAINVIDESIEVVIFDCLTFWVSNLLLHFVPIYRDSYKYQKRGITDVHLETEVINRVSQVISIAQNIKPQVIIISNEVGMGIVPETPLGRVFRDILGKANQIVTISADEVLLLVAGIPMKVK